MNRLKTLTKYFIKDALLDMFSGSKMGSKLIVVCMTAMVLFISFPFAAMIGTFYKPLHMVGQEGYLLAMILFVVATIIFFLGIFTIMNVFYFSSDIDHILPMPFKSSEIIFAKFAAVLINMYIYTGILILPLVVYGVTSSAGVMYYVYSIITLIITPILPMVIAALICMTLMRFTSLSKHKDAFRMVVGCLSLVLVVVFNLYTQNSGKNISPEEMTSIFSQGNNSLMDYITGLFITNKFASYGLLYSGELKGLMFILLTLGMSIAIFLAYYIIGGKLYLKGIVGMSESYSKRENLLEGDKASKVIKTSSPLKALVMRDIKVVLRTPQFFINCVAMMLYMPAIFGIMMFSRGQISVIRSAINNGSEFYSTIIIVAFIAASVSLSGGGAGLTALSREGKDFMISKYIPVSYKVQLNSKIISSLCINLLSTLIVAAALIFVVKNPVVIILGTVVAIGAAILITFITVFIDFKSPRLEWENEKAMFKGNFTPLLIMIGLTLVGVSLYLLSKAVTNYILMSIILVGLISASCLMLYKKLLITAESIYNEN